MTEGHDTNGSEYVDWGEGTERDPRLTFVAYTFLGCFCVAVWIAAGAGVYWQGVHWGWW